MLPIPRLQSDVCRGPQHALKPLPEKEIVMKKSNKAAQGASPNSKFVAGGVNPIPVDKPAARAKNRTVAAPEKTKPSSKTADIRHRPQRAASSSRLDKLVCRYCGSDDLAPSFIKRRDGRCRGCFKRRYGSAGPGKGKTSSMA
jgi:hypothetical protein